MSKIEETVKSEINAIIPPNTLKKEQYAKLVETVSRMVADAKLEGMEILVSAFEGEDSGITSG